MMAKRVLTALFSCFLALGCGDNKSSKDSPENPPAPRDGDSTRDDGNFFGGTVSKDGHFVVKLEWLKPVEAMEYLDARLTFADSQRQAPEVVANVTFEPWMPSMGHGTAMDDQVITQDATATNVFFVKDAFLIMGGEWEIKVSATVNGSRDTAFVPVRVP